MNRDKLTRAAGYVTKYLLKEGEEGGSMPQVSPHRAIQSHIRRETKRPLSLVGTS